MNFVPELFLALVVLCLCGCLGKGALILLYGSEKAQALTLADALIVGELIMIGLAVAAHITAVFTGQSFSRCVILFSVLLGTALVLSAGLLLFRGISEKKKGGKEPSCKERREKADHREKKDRIELFLWGVFFVFAAVQLIFLLRSAGIYTQGDMTVETVGSFLQTDAIYQVNPMTGQPYTLGIPSRLKILCLPTLYGIFCRLSGLSPEKVVTAAVPALVFISSYAAFYCAGKSLFPKSGRKRGCFLIIIAILMWAGGYLYGMDGFNLLYCGYRGVTVRNLILAPYLLSLFLRKKWRPVVLCILAEACIVWTFYGLGVCLLMTAGLFLAGKRRKSEIA